MQTVSLIYLQQVMNVPRGISFWIIIPFQISALLGLQVWSFYSNKFGRVKALKIGGLGFMAITLAACNSSSDDTAATPPAENATGNSSCSSDK